MLPGGWKGQEGPGQHQEQCLTLIKHSWVGVSVPVSAVLNKTSSEKGREDKPTTFLTRFFKTSTDANTIWPHQLQRALNKFAVWATQTTIKDKINTFTKLTQGQVGAEVRGHARRSQTFVFMTTTTLVTQKLNVNTG